ncbi:MULTISPECIES: TetR/AcrR family transcriptional regulator [Rhodococcus]|uniref:TetR/AcrR family transcriptional regulator n=1 Tax=Rhodococcus TaxID=1827 RepID=UPI00146DB5C7|nr:MULTISPECIES: TetR family transcriptional regulator [Rhodococcus]MDI9935262.1 TetR family transcriptional regulator [Rhodococcus sp. IEGM 1351]MDJ0414301.1 TetR family transcriptional regulator [Rhodococcus opacus]WKN57508.1 TetR family transcriptional regulator [Rhodococcus opacus]
MRKGVANDPLRKEKIAQAALDLLDEDGMRGTTHRTIAQRAGVPLGSVTYHYASLDDILVAAFELMGEQMDPRYGQPIRAASSQAEACEVLVDAICGERRATDREMRLHRELYALASRNSRLHALVRSFEERAIAALTTQFPEPAARALDALVEGWWIYQSWNPGRPAAADVRRSVRGLVDAFEVGDPDHHPSRDRTTNKVRLSNPS